MDTGSTPDLPAAVFENAHFGAASHRREPRHSSWIHEIRHKAQLLARQNDPEICWRSAFDCTLHADSHICPILSRSDRSARQKHFEEQLKIAYTHNEKAFETTRATTNLDLPAYSRRLYTRNRYYPNELDNDVAIARSNIPLPGERNHHRRPSLEREEAFYDQTTSKGKVRLQRGAASEDAQVAELYRKGILYNTGDGVKSVFDLNSIHHNEPTYIIRPAKRARKGGKTKRHGGPSYTLAQPLHLDLSFSDIGDDEAIARYFFASQQASPDELIQHASSQESNDSAPPPLRVIYELDGSQGSVDVDASQPPDLILDDEFELLSDSEMQDSPYSTQPQHAEPSSAAWVMVGDDL
ncbi:hypothetical protein NQ176_g3373 [Zarea fungicola]|uniref:Uncharacterized protein n=1 Tax=Zarea fungicola TaxID=93591 RepID=A0ACC1NIY7_9HYPO|nr:hypothetical protein NQ176_g3373 [Lecanicillium fungicola]